MTSPDTYLTPTDFLNCARELLEATGRDRRAAERARAAGAVKQKRRDPQRQHGKPGAIPRASGGQLERRQYLPTRREREYSRAHMDHE